jgi:hypothetical protein
MSLLQYVILDGTFALFICMGVLDGPYSQLSPLSGAAVQARKST